MFDNSISKIDTYLASSSNKIAPWIFWGSVIGGAGLLLGGAKYLNRPAAPSAVTVTSGDKTTTATTAPDTGAPVLAGLGAIGISVGSLVLIGVSVMAHKKNAGSFY